MLKAILYYLLLIAEFLITIIIGGSLVGIYMAIGETKGYLSNEKAFANEISPILIGMSFLSMFLVWFTFGHYKFSKFSLGKVNPVNKWKAMLYTCLPMFGITLAYTAAINLFHIDFLPKEMAQMEYTHYLPFAIIGSFFSAYVFYGAIQEELIRSGKKKWVQLLTLCLMLLPACIMSVTETGDFSIDLTFLGFISTVYGCWMYGKTRSTILLFVIYFTSNIIPFNIPSTPLCIVLIVVGIIMAVGGFRILRDNLPQLLTENEG